MKVEEVLTKEKMLETVVYRMMNRDANAELLDKIPHMRIMDLAAAYYCILGQEDGYHTDAFITWEHCGYFGIQKEELDAAARRNTEAGGFITRKFSEILGLPEEIRPVPDLMYVMTNQAALYGAAIILYEDYFRSLAEQTGGDLYILPSSIHELIAVPVTDGDLAGLQDIVKEVNGKEEAVSPYEVLSDNVYRYSRDGGLMCVTRDGKRK
ncbi:MAG: hypothetical protein HFH84_13090 [Lachnospiraceae bacterium]|nr:hypothetical protein [Lachnospiraceae bacterium]